MKIINNIKSTELTYHIFPAKRMMPSPYASIHDSTFNFFVRRWEEAFQQTKDQAKPATGWEDHFLKQDLICSITHNGNVVAAHLYSIYDLSAASTLRSECFSFISPQTIEKMKDLGLQNIISMEYLCVDQSLKYNSLEISFGKLITSLGAYLCEDKSIDAAIGTPIKNNNVDLMMQNVGAFHLQNDFIKYGYNVDLLLIPTSPAHPSKDPKVYEVAQDLWARRQDYTTNQNRKIAV